MLHAATVSVNADLVPSLFPIAIFFDWNDGLANCLHTNNDTAMAPLIRKNSVLLLSSDQTVPLLRESIAHVYLIDDTLVFLAQLRTFVGGVIVQVGYLLRRYFLLRGVLVLAGVAVVVIVVHDATVPHHAIVMGSSIVQA